ncbi:MAG: NADH:flavin oxidoreductase [Chloroflexi bacterium]|nr:NADH:flavin oxidoreductase [Chloroflexota bacterium]MCY4247965.1 NADH:flavin oxidoreductase [Chloroflexota bacterium]
MAIRRVAQLRTFEQFTSYCQAVGADLPIDEQLARGAASPLARPYAYRGRRLANRFCILPMEGWDGAADGSPTDLTRRRWRRFGQSGAKLIWGGEAVAVRHDGRANARQLVINAANLAGIAGLRAELLDAHAQDFAGADDLLIGLQLTHSGRFCRPNSARLEPLVLYRHPILDAKFQVEDDSCVMSDADIERLVEDFGQAAVFAQQAGFDFVDIKHCHGYLGHEFLSAVDRGGKYGGSFENRTRFLRETVELVRALAPGLDIGVRLSAIDWIPFQPGADRIGEPAPFSSPLYPYAFGGDGTGTGYDLSEPQRFLGLLRSLDIQLVCITAGSPYYNFHIQRPAIFPPSDGYRLPEDPLVGVARQIQVTAELKEAFPDMTLVGSGYSYLQDWLPHVAQAAARQGLTDFVGLGRMALSYPHLPADLLAGRPLQRKRICRTFSDCTTAPRNGMVSGCYPLDERYKARGDYQRLLAIKKAAPPR